MITTVVTVAVKCGSKGTLARLARVPDTKGAENYIAKRFRCRRCDQKWTDGDISCGADLDRVSCSNCYSSNVEITRLQISYLQAKDFGKCQCGAPAKGEMANGEPRCCATCAFHPLGCRCRYGDPPNTECGVLES